MTDAGEWSTMGIEQLMQLIDAENNVTKPAILSAAGNWLWAMMSLNQATTKLNSQGNALRPSWPPNRNASAEVFFERVDATTSSFQEWSGHAYSNYLALCTLEIAVGTAYTKMRALYDRYVQAMNSMTSDAAKPAAVAAIQRRFDELARAIVRELAEAYGTAGNALQVGTAFGGPLGLTIDQPAGGSSTGTSTPDGSRANGGTNNGRDETTKRSGTGTKTPQPGTDGGSTDSGTGTDTGTQPDTTATGTSTATDPGANPAATAAADPAGTGVGAVPDPTAGLDVTDPSALADVPALYGDPSDLTVADPTLGLDPSGDAWANAARAGLTDGLGGDGGLGFTPGLAVAGGWGASAGSIGAAGGIGPGSTSLPGPGDGATGRAQGTGRSGAANGMAGMPMAPGGVGAAGGGRESGSSGDRRLIDYDQRLRAPHVPGQLIGRLGADASGPSGPLPPVHLAGTRGGAGGLSHIDHLHAHATDDSLFAPSTVDRPGLDRRPGHAAHGAEPGGQPFAGPGHHRDLDAHHGHPADIEDDAVVGRWPEAGIDVPIPPPGGVTG